MAKKLTKSELLEMELNHSNKLVRDQELSNIELRKTNELLSLKIKQLEAQIKVGSIDKEIEAKKEQINFEKTKIRDFNNKLKNKHKIEGSWGINPDTGEILEEE